MFSYVTHVFRSLAHALLILAVGAGAASAQAVHVDAGDLGQGILRARGAECFVVTPFHVVENAIKEIRIIGDRAARSSAELIRELPQDLAVLRVSGQSTMPCTEWKVAPNFDDTLKSVTSGHLQIREPDGSRTLVPVLFRGVASDTISVQPSQQRDEIQQSMSGASLILSDGTLAGMLLRVESGLGTVYQIDDIVKVSDTFFSPLSNRTNSRYEAFVGDYDFGIMIATVAERGDGLTLAYPGQPVYELEPKGDRAFSFKNLANYGVEFRLGEDGSVSTLYLRQPQGAFEGVRVDGDPPDLKTLQAIAGTYEAGPLTITITLKPDGVLTFLVSNGEPLYVLRHIRGLRFANTSLPGYSTEFQRDAKGNITGFLNHQPNGTFPARRRR